VSAALVEDGIKVSTHSKRAKEIIKHPALRQCKNPYFNLKDISEHARYHPKGGAAPYPSAVACEQALQTHFRAVREFVCRHLAIDPADYC